MEDTFKGFTNEVVNEKVKIYTNREKSVGFIYPGSMSITISNNGDNEFLEIIMSEAISDQDYDLVSLKDGKLNPPAGFEKKFKLTNYELGRIRISRKAAQLLIKNIQDVLGRDKQ
jgi:hypothetical protein